MAKNRSVAEVVKVISDIYEEEFGGKLRGRYKIPRSGFRKLCGRSRLENPFLKQVIDAALDEGFVLIEIDDFFCIVEQSVMLSYRPVPKTVGNKYLPEESSLIDNIDSDDD